MVTHNEMFLHALARRLIVFQNGRVDVFEGTYRDFLEKVGWQEEIQTTKNRPAVSSQNNSMERLSKKKLRQLRSEIMARRMNTLKPVKKEMTTVESRIEALEKELARYNQAMIAASTAGNGKKIAALSREIHHLQAEMDRLFDTLEELTVTLEDREAEFEAELRRLA